VLMEESGNVCGDPVRVAWAKEWRER
jgi:hypothetical protein